MTTRTWGDAAQTVIMAVVRDHFRGVLPNPGERLSPEAEE